MPKSKRTASDVIHNPKPGDGTSRDFKRSLDGVIIRDVVDVRGGGGWVFFDQDNGYTVRHRISPISEWRKWAEKAEVFNVAD